MSGIRDHVSVRIDNILLGLQFMPSKPTIFRVNDDLRSVNQKLYDPKVVAIGPFHHEKDYSRRWSNTIEILKTYAQ